MSIDNTDELWQGKGENQVAAVACQSHPHEGSKRFSPADIEMAGMHKYENQELPCDLF
jgi:hypothetical protein